MAVAVGGGGVADHASTVLLSLAGVDLRKEFLLYLVNEVGCDVVDVQEAERGAAAYHQEQKVNVQGDSTSTRSACSRSLMRAGLLL